MLNWKKATKRYREVATEAMRLLKAERQLRGLDAAIVGGVMQLRDLLQKPHTPFVKLFSGQDVDVQKVHQNLIDLLMIREKLIQSYSQNNLQNTPSEKLDNTPPV